MWWQKWLSQKWKGIWLTGELLIEGTVTKEWKKRKKNWNIFSNKNRIGIESFFIRQTQQNLEFFKVKKKFKAK